MENEREQQRYIAERLRIAVKELRWAAGHLAAIYDMVKPIDMPPFEDPNQLSLFDEERSKE